MLKGLLGYSEGGGGVVDISIIDSVGGDGARRCMLLILYGVLRGARRKPGVYTANMWRWRRHIPDVITLLTPQPPTPSTKHPRRGATINNRGLPSRARRSQLWAIGVYDGEINYNRKDSRVGLLF